MMTVEHFRKRWLKIAHQFLCHPRSTDPFVSSPPHVPKVKAQTCCTGHKIWPKFKRQNTSPTQKLEREVLRLLTGMVHFHLFHVRENKALIRPGCCGKSSISSHPTGWHSDLESTSPEQGAVDLQQHTARKNMYFLHLPKSSWVGENNVAQKIVNLHAFQRRYKRWARTGNKFKKMFTC